MILVAALLALAPGLHAWWSGRALLTRADDPAFPELLLARAQRRIQIAIAVAVAHAFIAGAHWVWTGPLLVVAFLVGGFPFRRTLYGESWNVADYIGYTLAGFVGTAGIWIALAFAPAFILTIVSREIPNAPVQGALAIGAVVAAALVVWEIGYPLVWLRLHRASPLERADLLPRFDEIVRRSAVAQQPPRVFRYGAAGAYVMNAIALPSVRQPRVAFGDSLLELLTPDEIVAVFAHEVAHLEHYDRRRMLRLRIVARLLVLGAVALPALVLATAPALAWTIKLAWPTIVLVMLLLRASKSQTHETESDLRAGALTGDPEAMIRALTKLHHYSRMPRRWPYDFERAASHPSLARRIQALRTQSSPATTSPAPRLGAPTLLRSTEPGAYAALDDSRAYWFDGAPANATSMSELREQATSYRAVTYADLTELRVAVVRGGGRTLLARDKSGKTWSMPLHPDDVAAAQRTLDLLDVQLSNHVGEDWATKARVAATLLALAFVGGLDFSWPWIPLIVTLAKPSTASVAAMGVMAVGRVIITTLFGTFGVTGLGVSPATWVTIIATFAIGAWSCRLAWRRARGDERPTQRSFAVITFVCLATLLVGALAMARMYGSPAVTPLSPLQYSPAGSIALLLLGAGAALVTYRDKLRRRSGIATAAAGLLVAAATSGAQWLSTRQSDAPPLAWTTGTADVDGKLVIDGTAFRLHLSPSGQRLAVQGSQHQVRYDDDGNEEAVYLSRFTLGGRNGPRRTIMAHDLAFLDDERVIVLRPSPTSGDSLEITVERVEAGDGVRLSRYALPAYYAPALRVDRASGAWRVTGHDARARTAATAAGTVGSDSVTVTHLHSSVGGGRPLHTYRDGTSLVGTLHGQFGRRQMLLAMFGFYPFSWDLWRVVHGERQSVGTLPGMPECAPASGERETESVLCLAQGRSGLSLWRIDRADRVRPTPLAALPMNLDLWDIGPDGRVAVGARDGSSLAVVDVTSGRGTRVRLDDGVRLQSAESSNAYIMDVAAAPGVVATLGMRDGKSEVTFYRVR